VAQNRKSEQPAMARSIDLLDSITGIGFISAATLTAEFGDIALFKSAQSLTASAVWMHLSGSQVTSKGRAIKSQNAGPD